MTWQGIFQARFYRHKAVLITMACMPPRSLEIVTLCDCEKEGGRK
jgi:hypothetical protein